MPCHAALPVHSLYRPAQCRHTLYRRAPLPARQRLLSSGVRTTNGEEADYYFIPIKMRMGYDG